MEIRHLITFKAIIQTGSFSKAAELLNYSQSTVTFHIKAIEDELGAPIFDRIGKKVLLTEVGKKLLPYANQILNDFENLKEDIRGRGGEIKGQLKVTAPEALLIYRLLPIIKELKENFPGIEIEIQHLNSLNLRRDLSTGNVDVALLIEKDKTEEDIIFEKLCEEPMMLISPKPIRLNELNTLKGHVFLLTKKGCSYRAIFERLINENIHDISLEDWRKSSIEFESIDAIKQCIMCGFGIALLPYSAVSQEISMGLMYAKRLSSCENLSVYLSYHKDKWLSPSIQTFLNILRRHASKWRYEVTV